MAMITVPRASAKRYVRFSSCHARFFGTTSPSLFMYPLYSGAGFA